MSTSSAHERSIDTDPRRQPISGPQDRRLEIDFKSPIWKMIGPAASALARPAERHAAHQHHSDIGEMAVLGFEDGDILARLPEPEDLTL